MSNLQTQAANRYVVWNGEPKQYEMWKNKFLVNCRSRRVYKGFVLDKDNYPKLPDKSTISEEKKKVYDNEVEEFMDKNYKSFKHLKKSMVLASSGSPGGPRRALLDASWCLLGLVGPS